MMREALIAFMAGFIIEAVAVFWMHYSERGAAGRAALCSMLQAGAQVAGIGESIRDVRIAACFVFGFGLGTFVAVRWKSR